jgi:hypothetical protein
MLIFIRRNDLITKYAFESPFTPRAYATQTPDEARAKMMSLAAVISIIWDRFHLKHVLVGTKFQNKPLNVSSRNSISIEKLWDRACPAQPSRKKRHATSDRNKIPNCLESTYTELEAFELFMRVVSSK